jgi:hypothetical protein
MLSHIQYIFSPIFSRYEIVLFYDIYLTILNQLILSHLHSGIKSIFTQKITIYIEWYIMYIYTS